MSHLEPKQVGRTSVDRSAKTSNGSVASTSATMSAGAAPLSADAGKLVINGHANDVVQREGGQGSAAGQKGTEELWSSILNSVKSSRATPVKNVIVLGEGQTGKSTLLQRIAATSPSGFISQFHEKGEEDSAGDVTTSSGQANSAETTQAHNADLGLSYGYFDVGDDDGEDVVARVGVYQISSTHPANLSLLPFALHGGFDSTREKDPPSAAIVGGVHSNGKQPARTRISANGLRDCLFLITLDWEAPWTFLSQLIEWLDIIREAVESVGEEEKDVMASLREDVESYLRSYSEPAAAGGEALLNGGEEENEEPGNVSTASAIVPVSGYEEEDGKSPLPEGCLTHNYGVPIVVACTKADTIGQLERQRNFKEEQFDYIQQVLRIVCLKYGAALFFTAQGRPATFDVVREYLLHRLFASARHHSATGAFNFRHRASTVERDVLVVPAGWDSFGKIRALREGFDCASMANGWEWDTQVERLRRSRRLPKGSREAEEAAEGVSAASHDGTGSINSAVRLYEDIIEDWDAGIPNASQGNARLKEPDDQAFLLQHYNALQRDVEPRSRSGPRAGGTNGGSAATKGVVGPLGSAGFSSSVERAMQERQMDDGRSTVPGKALPRRESGTTTATIARSSTPTQAFQNLRGTATGGQTSSGVQSPSLSSGNERGSSRPTSPFTGTSGAAASGATSPSMSTPKQSEVLHSFFQSLLKEKPGSGPGGSSNASGGSAARASQSAARSGGGGGSGAAANHK